MFDGPIGMGCCCGDGGPGVQECSPCDLPLTDLSVTISDNSSHGMHCAYSGEPLRFVDAPLRINGAASNTFDKHWVGGPFCYWADSLFPNRYAGYWIVLGCRNGSIEGWIGYNDPFRVANVPGSCGGGCPESVAGALAYTGPHDPGGYYTLNIPTTGCCSNATQLVEASTSCDPLDLEFEAQIGGVTHDLDVAITEP